jgi:predicted nucleotidyltransferase|uniref:Kanamycin nucleotidyltransferase n=1 Tax=Myoviridae sp. ctPuP5 TaxID=2823543 RepID=A0A8S5L9U2_9CAUD|nr:MAG TPA: Kanamycin nucleotidyltransferase [Myoviridae sp. ctPuP5]
MDNRKFLGIYGILICFTMRKVIFNKDYLTILRENLQENLYDEVSMNDINLNPLEPKPQLNPRFWINGKLNSKVRLKLMDIADDFIQTLNVKWVKPLDVVFTGSLANYNWTKYSDIDIHVIMNYEEVYKNVEFVKEYFEMKKYSWAQDHDSLRIYGFPVELYVEDSNDAASSSGVYSIERNKWIVEPKPFDDNEFDEQYVKKTAAKLMTQVDELSDMIDSTDDEYKMDVLSKKVKRLNDKVKFIRQKSLKKDGEMGNGNIIYKAMRNAGYIDKLWDLKSKTYDKLNSLK